MNLLPLDSSEWNNLTGGYKVPYNPSNALRQLSAGQDSWPELWENLHHQGDLGLASYAVVPHLVEIQKVSANRSWQFYALVSTIEIERHRKSNPKIPDWLLEPYSHAWEQILDLAQSDLEGATDELFLQGVLSAIALAKGKVKLGAFLLYTEATERDEILEAQIAWSELYA